MNQWERGFGSTRSPVGRADESFSRSSEKAQSAARSSLAPVRGALLGCFFLSGVSTLIYANAWLGRLQINFSYASALITVGLSLGACLASRFVVGSRAGLIVYLALEALVSFWGLSFARMQNVVPAGVLLFVPATALGVLLPALMAHLKSRRELAALCAAGTFGSAIGAILSSYWLLPVLGFTQTMLFGALVNAVLVFIALTANQNSNAEERAIERIRVAGGRGHAASSQSVTAISKSTTPVLLFMTGLTMPLLAGVWANGGAFKTSLVTVFLTGIGLGSLTYIKFGEKSDSRGQNLPGASALFGVLSAMWSLAAFGYLRGSGSASSSMLTDWLQTALAVVPVSAFGGAWFVWLSQRFALECHDNVGSSSIGLALTFALLGTLAGLGAWALMPQAGMKAAAGTVIVVFAALGVGVLQIHEVKGIGRNLEVRGARNIKGAQALLAVLFLAVLALAARLVLSFY